MIEIIAVGKLSTPGYKLAYDHYSKQIAHLNMIEIKETTIQTESKSIEKLIDQKAFLIVLAMEGNQFSSEFLAEKLQIPLESGQKIQCVIGGSEGLSETIKKQANLILSMSLMTFPHQLARVMIVEQLYRVTKILKKHPYHK
jgi:23S rRNA (pseudouridine1915-N3)-methyltransferase